VLQFANVSVELTQRKLRALPEFFALIGNSKALALAFEQAESEIILELTDLVAN
jgi:hypothetical protein